MGMQAGVDDDSFGHWSSCYVSYKGKGRLEIMMGLYSGDCCNGGSVQILNLYVMTPFCSIDFYGPGPSSFFFLKKVGPSR